MTDSSDVIRVLRELRSEWVPLLDRSDIPRADALLDEALTADSDRVREIENEILKVVEQTPQAQSFLGERLPTERIGPVRVYYPVAGDSVPVPVGTLMVCPIDPSHNRRYLRQAGQVLRCAEHNVQLVPADSATSKE